MLNKTMLDALNEQMKKEFNSAYIYLSMAAYFEGLNLSGMSSWMKHQYEEEVEHAMKLFGHIVERGETPTVPGIDKPKSDFGSPLAAFEAALKHEQFITDSINKLYDVAVKEDDKPAQIMLHWFIEEQVEEEDSVGTVVDQLKLVGDSGAGLMMIDRSLAQRA
jgi:ferritin